MFSFLQDDRIRARVRKECADVGIDNELLLNGMLYDRKTGVSRNIAQSPLGLLCHVFFDLLEKDQLPSPTLKEFLAQYPSVLESKDTVEVRVCIERADFEKYEIELMPKLALEYLDLVDPIELIGDDMYSWNSLYKEMTPTWTSIAPEKWLSIGGRWSNCIATAEDQGASYDYFVKHYTDEDRDARTRAIWVGDE